ncbi:uncharacterized protein TNCV_111831 [Trichonephila clavipes]|nr:uncharacterized protein TNCV_111831 [Trichonephila clavipes]
MGKKGNLSPCKKAELKILVNAKLFSKPRNIMKVETSAASVRRIKKKIESGEELSPKRKKKMRQKAYFHLNLEEWFPNGKPYIFMQVEAPCHTAWSIKAFLAEQNIPLLDWPGNSPDMNPIENFWELMKREVAKDVITNKTLLLERIIPVWVHNPQIQDTGLNIHRTISCGCTGTKEAGNKKKLYDVIFSGDVIDIWLMSDMAHVTENMNHGVILNPISECDFEESV